MGLCSNLQYPEPQSVASVVVPRTIWDSLGKQTHLQKPGRHDAGAKRIILSSGSGRSHNFT